MIVKETVGFFHMMYAHQAARVQLYSRFSISEIRYAHMLEEVAGGSCTGKHEVTKLPLQLNLPEKVDSRRVWAGDTQRRLFILGGRNK